MSADYKKALRSNLRFAVVAVNGVRTISGQLSTEDLWNLSLEQLDTVGISLKKQIKEQGEESLIKKQSTGTEKLQLAFDIVKDVIDTKLEEAEKAKIAKDKKIKRQQILELMAKKQDEALGAKSLEDLAKELEELEKD